MKRELHLEGNPTKNDSKICMFFLYVVNPSRFPVPLTNRQRIVASNEASPVLVCLGVSSHARRSKCTWTQICKRTRCTFWSDCCANRLSKPHDHA